MHIDDLVELLQDRGSFFYSILAGGKENPKVNWANMLLRRGKYPDVKWQGASSDGQSFQSFTIPKNTATVADSNIVFFQRPMNSFVFTVDDQIFSVSVYTTYQPFNPNAPHKIVIKELAYKYHYSLNLTSLTDVDESIKNQLYQMLLEGTGKENLYDASDSLFKNSDAGEAPFQHFNNGLEIHKSSYVIDGEPSDYYGISPKCSVFLKHPDMTADMYLFDTYSKGVLLMNVESTANKVIVENESRAIYLQYNSWGDITEVSS